MVEHLEAARLFATDVEALGCKLALDDFGTGFGSFTYLSNLPLSYIKIDRSHVHALAGGIDDQRLVRSIIGIGGLFGLQTVAEGIEDETTLELLRDLGADLAQGFHLGRPSPVAGWSSLAPRTEAWLDAVPTRERNHARLHPQEHEDVHDSAPEFGFGDVGETAVRQGRTRLRAGRLHLSPRPMPNVHSPLRPSPRGGRGGLRRDLRLGPDEASTTRSSRSARLDTIRVAPEVWRGFSAGPDGLEVLAFGARHDGDGEVDPKWWVE